MEESPPTQAACKAYARENPTPKIAIFSVQQPCIFGFPETSKSPP